MKRVLVTGGSRGLGMGICQRLLVDGYQVIATSRKASPELERMREQFGDQLEYHPADLGDRANVRVLSKNARLLEGVDGFVANAGIGVEGLLTLMSDEAIQECVRVNLLSNLLLAREVIKGMMTRGGSLVFVSSVAAITGFSGLSVYAATKGALVSFSRALAREYGEKGIRSNCVLPGFLETDMNRNLGEEVRQRLTRRTALKRLGQPTDAVGAVSYLLSEDARYVTGAELVVDGGMTA